MTMANPIYGTVFKKLMKDNETSKCISNEIRFM
jgi:hypothetical protein